jgi:hypothetical protein
VQRDRARGSGYLHAQARQSARHAERERNKAQDEEREAVNGDCPSAVRLIKPQ